MLTVVDCKIYRFSANTNNFLPPFFANECSSLLYFIDFMIFYITYPQHDNDERKIE